MNALSRLLGRFTFLRWVAMLGLVLGAASPALASSTAPVLAAGAVHTCALTSGGSVKCWGSNGSGQLGDGSYTARPTPVDVIGLGSGVTAISTGWSHTCALTISGGIKCWGENVSGQLGDGTSTLRLAAVDVVGLTGGVTAISAGANHTCALTSNGGIKCWGSNSSGQLGDGTSTLRLAAVDVVGLTSGVTAISAGDNHTCALTSNGGIKCWGSNSSGQLGDGSTTPQLSPVNVSGLTSGVSSIAAGGSNTCALIAGGVVKCWGNGFGLFPATVTGLSSDVIAISAGGLHMCALTASGLVKCWGANTFGQKGDGTTEGSWSPAADVLGLNSAALAISAGSYHTCALTSGGGVKCWGNNNQGQLGDGVVPYQLTPVDVSGLGSGVFAISAGNEHTCAVTSGGASKCWGANSSGQLGDSTNNSALAPVNVSGLTSGETAISAGSGRTCALSGGGALACWGDGLGSVPAAVSGLSGSVAMVEVGTSFCALTSGGAVQCWGSNTSGELGDGSTTIYSYTPVNVSGLTSGVTAISVGYQFACALTSGGSVKCWGHNGNGQLGDGSYTTRSTPVDVVGLGSGVIAISVGAYDACALIAGGSVKCWGYLGTPAPVLMSGLASGVAAISVGYGHRCALTSAGGVKCWGWNEYGQLGDGSSNVYSSMPVNVSGLSSGVTAISAGRYHTCALTSGGVAKCWGSNSFGQLGNGPAGFRSAASLFVVGLNLLNSQTIGAITFNPTSLTVGGTTTAYATATSGLAVTFRSASIGVCTVAGHVVSGVSVGLCTIGANQGGDGSFAPAPEMLQVFSVTAVLTVPGAPTILSITPGPGRVTITLQPPSNTGGGAIAGYSATCTASGHPNVTGTSITTTIIVPGLVPGVSYSCTATASNGSYVSFATSATSAVPKPKVDPTPILMLLLD